MSCFCGCFRIKQHDQGRRDFISKSISSNQSVPAVSRTKLASVLSYEEDGSSPQQSASRVFQGRYDRSEKGLKDEAPALKNYNELLAAPAEIRKATGSCRTSLKKLFWDETLDWPYVSSNRLNEDSNTQQTSSICNKLDEQHSRLHDGSCSNRDISAKSTLPEDVEQAYGKDSSQFHSVSNLDSSSSKHSPFPGPLKVPNDMQIPETFSLAKKVDSVPEMSARIRSKYLHPVLNPVKNSSEWRALKESFHHQNESGELEKQVNSAEDPKESHSIDTHINGEFESLDSPSSVIPALNNEEQHVVVSSLSQWLRPQPPRDHENSGTVLRDRPCSARSADEDRPIIGMVAAHWSEDEPSNPPPVWWDGNGIPNLTNKYKEDQTVSYYATSFEERLEKALSEESLLTQRKLDDTKGIKVEGDEDDTAESRSHI